MASPKTTQPALYRVFQFFAALKASLPTWAGGVRDDLAAPDRALVASILPTSAQQRLFDRMLPNDQRHAIAVVRTLQQAGHHDPALMQAALLHDVAKSIGQPIIYRVLIVLGEAFWPSALAWLSTPRGWASLQAWGDRSSFSPYPAPFHQVSWWRRPFVVHAQHPAIGAAWAQEAACEPLAVRLIARHQDELPTEPSREADKLLAVLQWADDLN